MAPSEFLRNYYSVTKFMVIAPLVIQWQYLCELVKCFMPDCKDEAFLI